MSGTILTVNEAKNALDITDDDDLDVLESYITAVSRKLDQCVGTLICSTITAELHDGGRSDVWVDHHPVYSVTQVVEYDSTTAATLTAESNSSKPADSYWANTTNGRVVRRSSNSDGTFPIGRDNVLVSYVAGRYTSLANVDERYKAAAGLMLRNLWRTRESSVTQVGEFDVPTTSFPTFAIPKAVKELLGDEWRTSSGIGA